MGGKPVSTSSRGNFHHRQGGTGSGGSEETAMTWASESWEDFSCVLVRNLFGGVRQDTHIFSWKWCTGFG